MNQRWIFRILVLFATGVLFNTVDGQAADPPIIARDLRRLPPATEVLVDGTDATKLAVTGDAGSREFSVVPVSGQSFRQAVHVDVLKPTRPVWGIQLFVRNRSQAVKKNDTLLLAYSLRSHGRRAPASINAVVHQIPKPHTTIIRQRAVPTDKWQRFYAVRVVEEDFAATELEVQFQLGIAPQSIELGGIAVYNLGPDVALETIPQTPVDYSGRDKNAAWRGEAKARIEKFRKADLAVTVVNTLNKSVGNAAVQVRMRKHRYGFGTYVTATLLKTDSEDGDQFRKNLSGLFNHATAPLYWQTWMTPGGRRKFLAIADWLKTQQLTTRGHPVFYPKFRLMPEDVVSLSNNPEALRARIREHVVDVTTATEEFHFDEYDVTNELRDLKEVTDILGRDEVLEWFRLVHQKVPHSRLAINENGILEQGGHAIVEQDDYANTIQFLIDADVHLGVIGLQAHFSDDLSSPRQLLKVLDRFAKFGLPLHVTEFDINVEDEQLQADYLRDFLTVAFSHPATEAVTQWGFWEGEHWRPGAALIRQDWTMKPAGLAYQKLVHSEWRTEAEGITNEDGQFRIRGFLGDYDIVVTKDGIAQSFPVTLDGPATEVTLSLP